MDGKELLRGFSDVDDAIVEEMLKKRRLGLNTARRGGKGVIMRMIGFGAAVAAAAAVIIAAVMGGFSDRKNTPVKSDAQDKIIHSVEEAGTDRINETGEETEQDETAEDNKPCETFDETGAFETGKETEAHENSEGTAPNTLPFSEKDEKVPDPALRCLITAAQDGLDILEPDGSLIMHFENARALIWAESSIKQEISPLISRQYLYGDPVSPEYSHQIILGENNGFPAALLWDKAKPLPIVFPDTSAALPGDSEALNGACGIYDIETNQWICDPSEHSHMRLLSDILWTDAPDNRSGGTLYHIDGTILDTFGASDGEGETGPADDQHMQYTRGSTFVSVYETGNIFSLQGDQLTSAPPYTDVIDVMDVLYVVSEREAASEYPHTLFYDFAGDLKFAENSGLIYRGFAGRYINWEDQSENSLITDRQLNQVMTTQSFFEKNKDTDLQFLTMGSPGRQGKWKMQVIEFMQNGDLTVRLRNEDYTDSDGIRVICDSDFNILHADEREDIRWSPEFVFEDPQQSAEAEWSRAGLLSLGKDLYFTDERGLIARSADDGNEKILAKESEAGKTLKAQTALSGNALYFVRNGKTCSSIHRYLFHSGRTETVWEQKNAWVSGNGMRLTADGDIDPEYTALRLLAVLGNKLLFTSGSWGSETSYLLDLSRRSLIPLMKGTGELLWTATDEEGLLIALKEFSSDYAPNRIQIFREDGSAVFDRASYQSCFLKDGFVYYQDDTAYYHYRNEAVAIMIEGGDPPAFEGSRTGPLVRYRLSDGTQETLYEGRPSMIFSDGSVFTDLNGNDYSVWFSFDPSLKHTDISGPFLFAGELEIGETRLIAFKDSLWYHDPESGDFTAFYALPEGSSLSFYETWAYDAERDILYCRKSAFNPEIAVLEGVGAALQRLFEQKN